MKEFINLNNELFDNSSDSEYLFTQRHQLRRDAAIDLLREVVEKDNPDNNKLLSLGCSTGVYEEEMKNQLGLDVYGVDSGVNTLITARSREIEPINSDVSSPLPFRDKSFDFVFAGELVEHVFDTRKFLTEINRVLKPGGYVVLTTPNLARLDDRFKLLVGKTPKQTSPMHPFLSMHIRPFTYDSLKHSLSETGFEKFKLKSNALIVDILSKTITLDTKFFVKLFPTLGSSLIVRARKTKEENLG